MARRFGIVLSLLGFDRFYGSVKTFTIPARTVIFYFANSVIFFTKVLLYRSCNAKYICVFTELWDEKMRGKRAQTF